MRLFTPSARKALLAGTLGISFLSSGCVFGTRYYDVSHSDYHHWRRSERAPYARWEAEQHRQHEEYRNLRNEDVRAYWNWRHDHP